MLSELARNEHGEIPMRCPHGNLVPDKKHLSEGMCLVCLRAGLPLWRKMALRLWATPIYRLGKALQRPLVVRLVVFVIVLAVIALFSAGLHALTGAPKAKGTPIPAQERGAEAEASSRSR